MRRIKTNVTVKSSESKPGEAKPNAADQNICDRQIKGGRYAHKYTVKIVGLLDTANHGYG